MHIVKRIFGIAFTLLAVALLVVPFGAGGDDGTSQSVLDSPNASGRLLGTMIPVVFFGVIGIWLLVFEETNEMTCNATVQSPRGHDTICPCMHGFPP